MREYKQKTKVLGIPVIGYKDGIFPEVELRKWQLVENILMAATRSMKNCIFEEGAWNVRKEPDDTYSVSLKNDAARAVPSISGVIRGVYFSGGPSVSWMGLQPNKKHYLYLSTVRGTRLDPKAIRTYSAILRKTGRDIMPIAILDLTGESPKLDKHPESKVYSDSMAAPGMMLRPEMTDFKSAGNDGFLISSQRKIAFIQVSRMYAGDLNGKMGDIAVGYYGIDESVESDRQAILYNSGDSGIPLRALVFCE
jgi:hypothetical protein